jgi:hypothetical protein
MRGTRLFKSHGVALGGHVGGAHGGMIIFVDVAHAGVGLGGRKVGLGGKVGLVGGGGVGIAGRVGSAASRPQMTVPSGVPMVCSSAWRLPQMTVAVTTGISMVLGCVGTGAGGISMGESGSSGSSGSPVGSAPS